MMFKVFRKPKSKLRKFREKYGLTQAQMANKVGVTITTYWMWEKGTATPNSENAEKLNKIIGEYLSKK